LIWRLGLMAVLAVGLWFGVQYMRQEPNVPSGKPIVDVVVPNLSSELVVGREAFNANCASCHGANAAGQDGVAPPLVHKIYEPNHHGDMAFRLAAKNGVRQHHWPFGNMPPVANVTDRNLDSIIGYVRALQRANGIN